MPIRKATIVADPLSRRQCGQAKESIAIQAMAAVADDDRVFLLSLKATI